MEVEVGVDEVVDEVASAVDGEADAGETEVEAGKLDAVVVDDEVLGVEEVVDDEGAEGISFGIEAEDIEASVVEVLGVISTTSAGSLVVDLLKDDGVVDSAA